MGEREKVVWIEKIPLTPMVGQKTSQTALPYPLHPWPLKFNDFKCINILDFQSNDL